MSKKACFFIYCEWVIKMSKLRLFCYKQFFKIHIFCLLMMVVFRLIMNVELGFFMWISLIISVFCTLIHSFTKSDEITEYMYAIMAVLTCISLSLVTKRMLIIALRIDIRNFFYFLIAMSIFAIFVMWCTRAYDRRRINSSRKEHGKIDYGKRFQYLGWAFLIFLFFYQIILSYVLRPNVLTIIALSISHLNLLLIMFTYFDLKNLNTSKRIL